MTISRAEVITLVERRRRWSQEEKERLVAASLEPGASVSEVARVAGLHVSQLFRWRKELCKHAEASIAPFVPVEIGPSVPRREVAEAPLATTSGRRGKAKASSRLILVPGTASGSMATSMATRSVVFSMLWCADDPGSDVRASVAGDRPHGYAPRLSVVGAPSAGGAAKGPAQRSSVRLPWSAQQSCEDDLARCAAEHEGGK